MTSDTDFRRGRRPQPLFLIRSKFEPNFLKRVNHVNGMTMATNPSHLLIARNSRNNHNPSASLSIATETHAAAAGVFRSAGSPPWTLQEHEVDIAADVSESEDDASIEIDDTFTRHSQLPGTVKIIVESTTFW